MSARKKIDDRPTKEDGGVKVVSVDLQPMVRVSTPVHLCPVVLGIVS